MRVTTAKPNEPNGRRIMARGITNFINVETKKMDNFFTLSKKNNEELTLNSEESPSPFK